MGEIINNLKLGLAGLVLAGSLNGCGTFIKNIKHEFALKKYIPLTTEQKDSLFKELNPGLKDCLKEIYIIDQKDLRKDACAHTHHDGTICFSEYDSETRFHESAHAKHHALNDNKSDFSKEWREIANFKYGRRNIKISEKESITWKIDGTNGPKNGCLRPYSGKSIYEDVATFIECLAYDVDPQDMEKIDTNLIKNLEEKISKRKFETDSLIKEKNSLPKPSSSFDSLLLESKSLIIRLYCNIMSYDSSIIDYEKMKPFTRALKLTSSYPIFFADTTDHRYQKKLDLLEEYNFLTKEEHEKLSKNLGSLNYLLKEK